MLALPDKTLIFDTETTGLYPHGMESRRRQGIAPDRPFMFQIGNLDGEVLSFRGDVNPKTREVTYNKCKSELKWLKAQVRNAAVRVVMHEALFEQRMTTQSDLGFSWDCQIDDTKIMARIANSDEISYQLKVLAQKYCGMDREDEKALKKALTRARAMAKRREWTIATKETHGKGSKFADYWLPELAEIAETYGELDVVRTCLLYMMYVKVFRKNKKKGGRLLTVYDWERRVLRTCHRMETYGMTYLHKSGRDLTKFYRGYMAEHRVKIDALGYESLNLQSSKQMKEVFIEQLGYTTQHLTKKNAPKIDAEQLMAWARGSSAGADVDGDGPDGCRLSRSVLEWKAGKKVIEYLDSYEFFRSVRPDGSSVLHPAWDPGGARTGRFSCHDPNLQQIASAETSRRHSHIRARQREAFGPRPGYLWYMPDYSQIEVWAFAFVAKEKKMMDALLSGQDFHLSTAAAAWGHRKDFCTCGVDRHWKEKLPRELHKKSCLIKWWRQRAKMILFSRLYGGGKKKIAFLIRCTLDEATEFIEDFNNNLPGVKEYMDDLVQEVRETGILVNLFGREYEIERDRAYKAVNYMIQGSCAEILKRALVRIDNYLEEERPESRLIGTVHDEIITEIAMHDHSVALMKKIISLMQHDSKVIPNLPVPLPVGLKMTSSHWSAAKEVTFLKRAA
jgi:DNA polymerase-1